MSPQPLFVTRKFPPSVGGMETLSQTVWTVLQRAEPHSRKISYGGKNDVGLLLWLLRTLVRVTGVLLRRQASVVLVGDALTFAALAPVLLLSRTRSVTMVMGLDLTYPNALYRAVVIPLLRRAPQVLAISTATAEQAKAVGVPADRVGVVRLGVEIAPPATTTRAEAHDEVAVRWGLPADAAFLLTLGRLVRRKGARWFVAEVLPSLPPHVHYVLAGAGGEEAAIREAAEGSGVADRVHLIGRVSDDERELLLRGVDLFVQPNIKVPGDMEGFGLVTIEAVLHGLPVVAADLEGIKDAVVPGVTGTLLPSGDVETWTATITELIADRAALAEQGARFRAHAEQLYSDTAMGASLSAALDLPLASVGS